MLQYLKLGVSCLSNLNLYPFADQGVKISFHLKRDWWIAEKCCTSISPDWQKSFTHFSSCEKTRHKKAPELSCNLQDHSLQKVPSPFSWSVRLACAVSAAPGRHCQRSACCFHSPSDNIKNSSKIPDSPGTLMYSIKVFWGLFQNLMLPA